MTSDKGILIKNIYYMLAYAFQVLKPLTEQEIDKEAFEDAEDLLAEIVLWGVSQQIKRGLHREYVVIDEDTTCLKGKLNLNATMKHLIQQKKLLACTHDEFSVDNQCNRIIKTTLLILIRHPLVKQERKFKLKNILPFFGDIDHVDPLSIPWNTLQMPRHNKAYSILLRLCEFTLNGIILTTEKGKYTLTSFSHDHMHKLFEKFVLEYYKRHYPKLNARAARIDWHLTSPFVIEGDTAYLPAMCTDITLQNDSKTLIIDTKYYSKDLNTRNNKEIFHSHNLYQIFSYVKNCDKNLTGSVSGLILYAKTKNENVPDCSFMMGGNRIGVRTLDLNQEFTSIKTRLNAIVEDYF